MTEECCGNDGDDVCDQRRRDENSAFSMIVVVQSIVVEWFCKAKKHAVCWIYSWNVSSNINEKVQLSVTLPLPIFQLVTNVWLYKMKDLQL